MNELFKTVRLTHRVFVVLCIGAIIFALTDNESAARARTDLEKLLKQGKERALQSTFQNAVSDISGQYRMEMVNSLDRAGIAYEDTVFIFPSLPAWTPLDTTWSTLQEWILRIHTVGDIRVFLPQKEDLDIFISTLRRRLESINLENSSVYGLSLGDAVFNESSLRGRKTDVSIIIRNSDDHRFTEEIELSIGGRTMAFGPEGFRDWIPRLDAQSSFVAREIVNDYYPNLLNYWPDFRDKSLKEAEDELHRIEQESRASIQFVGLTLPSTVIYLAVPLFLLALQVHMFVFIHRISKLDRRYLARDAMAWVCLFPGWTSGMINVLSVLLLPGVAIWLLLRDQWNIWTLLIGIAVCVYGLVSVILLYLTNQKAKDI